MIEPTNALISADEIIRLVTERGGHASFAELMRHFGEAARGDMALHLGVPNVYIWAGVSDEFADAWFEAQPRLELESTHFLVYFIDGATLHWPIARRIPKQGYKKEHWLPVVFSVKDEA